MHIWGEGPSLLTYALWLYTQVHVPVLVLFLGCFIYLIQGMATAELWNMWFRLYTGCRHYDSSTRIDVGVLNESGQWQGLCLVPAIVIMNAVNLDPMQQWDQRSIVFCIGGSLIIVDVASKYLKYYLWHGYKLREIPTEVSIFGFFKLDLVQDFVKPARIRLDDSCKDLFYMLCFCCLSAEQREIKRREAIGSTTNLRPQLRPGGLLRHQ